MRTKIYPAAGAVAVALTMLVTFALFVAWCVLCGIGYELRKPAQ